MTSLTAPQIEVYASLPQNVVLDTGHSLRRTDWCWVHCLSLPLEELNKLQLSQRPYKWIRYAIGVVLGAEGTLSTSCDPHDIVDYDTASLLAGSADLYFHTSEEEKERLFPVDPHILRTHTTSSPTTRREIFFDNIVERDEGQCVLSDVDGDLCDVVHLLARSKDKYIETYTQHRSRDTNGGDIIREIDSIRNGLVLNPIAHGRLGEDLAFLVTPNFAMNTADIDLDADPAEWRCTSHFFDTRSHFLAVAVPPSGSPLRIFDTPEYPPAILFDLVYAGVVLHHFGTPAVKDGLTTTWNNIYHPTGVMNSGHSDFDARAAGTGSGAQEHEISEKARRKIERKMARDDPDIDMFDMFPFIMIPRDRLEACIAQVRESAEAAELGRVKEKVNEWIKTINSE